MLMGGQNSLNNTYGKSRLLEKKKRTLMKSNIKKNTHLIDVFAIPTKKKKNWLIKFLMFQIFGQN